MQPLDCLLATLSPKNRTDFKKWIVAQGHSKKDLKLFEILIKYSHLTPAALVRKVYRAPKMEAYTSARRRLHAKLIDFLIIVETNDDISQAGRTAGLLLIALRCMRHKQESATVHYLKLAEKLAREAKQLGLLDQILYLHIKHSEHLNQDVSEMILRWEENTRDLQSFRQIEIAFAEIRSQLRKAKQEGKVMNVDTIIHDVFNRFKITRQQASDPDAMLRLIGIGRAAYISVKEYRKLEPFIERFYFRFKKAGVFVPSLAHCELDYLYLLAHTYYRNCKFDKAQLFLDQMEVLLDEHRTLRVGFAARTQSLRAGIYCYTGRNDEAVRVLQRALRSTTIRQDDAERVNMQLNLAVYYFNAARYKDAIRQLNELPKDDQLTLHKGREWTMKKQMIQMIVLYEAGNDDAAEALLKRILKTYSDLWEQPLFALSHNFLHFAKQIFEDRSVTEDPKFKSDLNAVRRSTNAQQNDIQAISFYNWLKIKIIGGDYYDQLVSHVNKKSV